MWHKNCYRYQPRLPSVQEEEFQGRKIGHRQVARLKSKMQPIVAVPHKEGFFS